MIFAGVFFTHMEQTATYEGEPCIRCGSTERSVKYRRCVPCKRARRKTGKQRAKLDPDKRQLEAARLAAKNRKRYGIDEAEYERRIEEQHGLCAICEEVPHDYFAVDHCHDTGKVRGLLCRKCNVGIGMLKDDPKIVQRAAAYLLEHSV